MANRYVWLVEMLVDGYDDKWEPTVGTSLTRRDGWRELREWRTDNPSDRFRLVKYVAEDK